MVLEAREWLGPSCPSLRADWPEGSTTFCGGLRWRNLAEAVTFPSASLRKLSSLCVSIHRTRGTRGTRGTRARGQHKWPERGQGPAMTNGAKLLQLASITGHIWKLCSTMPISTIQGRQPRAPLVRLDLRLICPRLPCGKATTVGYWHILEPSGTQDVAIFGSSLCIGLPRIQTSSLTGFYLVQNHRPW